MSEALKENIQKQSEIDSETM